MFILTKQGIVVADEGENIKIKIRRSSACGESCASCGICGSNDLIISVPNSDGLNVGDIVDIEITDNKILKYAFLIYIVPLVFLLAGYFSGSYFWDENTGIGLSIALFILSFALMYKVDQHIKKKSDYIVTVTITIPNEQP